MRIYKHRQVGTLILFALGIGVALMVMVWILGPGQPAVTSLALVILLACISLFGSLTVEVTENELTMWFGPGVIRKSFRSEDIQDARIVRNVWYYGWGIRLTPHGGMFNVSGLDAVELELKNSRKFRIGTDDPQQLLAAIQRASQLAGSES